MGCCEKELLGAICVTAAQRGPEKLSCSGVGWGVRVTMLQWPSVR